METSSLTLVTSVWVTLVQVLCIFLCVCYTWWCEGPPPAHTRKGRQGRPPRAMRVAPPAPSPQRPCPTRACPPGCLLPSLAPASLSIRLPWACGGGSFPRGPCGAHLSHSNPHRPPPPAGGTHWAPCAQPALWHVLGPPTLWPRPPKMELEESSGLHRPLEPTILHTGVKL